MALTQISTDGIKNGTISTADLADGAITNAQIASNAAIAGTKISPDFGSQKILTSGEIETNSILKVSSLEPRIRLIDGNNNPNYSIYNQNGAFKIYDETSAVDRFVINGTDGHIDIAGNLDVGAGLDVTGNITATGTVPATNIDISGVTTSSALQVVFSTGNSGTAKTLAVDSTSSKFTYDPGSNLLQVDNIKLPDSSGSDGKINLGTGVGTVGDFQLYFDGSAGVIKNTTGNLFVQSIGDVKLRTNDSELAVNCIVDSAVELYHNSTSGSASRKLETYSDGVIVTGNLHADSGNNYVRSVATDGCIEIRRGAGEPFIDFKVNDVDFDARIIKIMNLSFLQELSYLPIKNLIAVLI